MTRNIVICCDGTWNRFDRERNTNVVKLCYCVEHHDPGQVVYYDPGVGTIAASRMRTELGRAFSKLLGGAIGAGIGHDIEQAYSFLAQQYVPGDQVFLFGFSRGAYAVRALAAVLKMFGLLERGNDNLYPYVREMLLKRRNGKPDFELAGRFLWTFSRPIRVQFLGVWDTVSSVGWITAPLSLPHTKENDIVEIVRHAVSIDERRKYFRHNLLRRANGQDFKEVWFAGAHADVGGGYAEAESGLSKIALAWMLREAQKSGLRVDEDRKRRMLGEAGDKYCRPDATAKLHDPFESFLWRLAQRLPRRTFRMGTDPPEPYWDWSAAPRARTMPEDAVLHRTVVERMGDQKLDYRPQNLDDPRNHPIED